MALPVKRDIVAIVCYIFASMGSVLRLVSRSHVRRENRVVKYSDDRLEVLLRVYGSSNLA